MEANKNKNSYFTGTKLSCWFLAINFFAVFILWNSSSKLPQEQQKPGQQLISADNQNIETGLRRSLSNDNIIVSELDVTPKNEIEQDNKKDNDSTTSTIIESTPSSSSAAAVVKSSSSSSATATSCLNPNLAQPYVLMSMGRSGSSITWQLIGNLTGMETKHHEYPGANEQQENVFYKKWEKTNPDRTGEWAIDSLCEKQLKYKGAGVVGYKLKPYTNTHPQFLAALDLIANARNPAVKIVRLRRNPLDVYLSRTKHSYQRFASKCDHGNERCVKRHLNVVGGGMEIDPKDLLENLKELSGNEDEVDDLLRAKGVSHVSVSYEKLYFSGEDVSEWTKIVDFLIGGSKEPITRERIESAMSLAVTNNPNHKETIKNYEEIKNALADTGFQYLLR